MNVLVIIPQLVLGTSCPRCECCLCECSGLVSPQCSIVPGGIRYCCHEAGEVMVLHSGNLSNGFLGYCGGNPTYPSECGPQCYKPGGSPTCKVPSPLLWLLWILVIPVVVAGILFLKHHHRKQQLLKVDINIKCLGSSPKRKVQFPFEPNLGKDKRVGNPLVRNPSTPTLESDFISAGLSRSSSLSLTMQDKEFTGEPVRIQKRPRRNKSGTKVRVRPKFNSYDGITRTVLQPAEFSPHSIGDSSRSSSGSTLCSVGSGSSPHVILHRTDHSPRKASSTSKSSRNTDSLDLRSAPKGLKPPSSIRRSSDESDAVVGDKNSVPAIIKSQVGIKKVNFDLGNTDMRSLLESNSPDNLGKLLKLTENKRLEEQQQAISEASIELSNTTAAMAAVKDRLILSIEASERKIAEISTRITVISGKASILKEEAACINETIASIIEDTSQCQTALDHYESTNTTLGNDLNTAQYQLRRDIHKAADQADCVKGITSILSNTSSDCSVQFTNSCSNIQQRTDCSDNCLEQFYSDISTARNICLQCESETIKHNQNVQLINFEYEQTELMICASKTSHQLMCDFVESMNCAHKVLMCDLVSKASGFDDFHKKLTQTLQSYSSELESLIDEKTQSTTQTTNLRNNITRLSTMVSSTKNEHRQKLASETLLLKAISRQQHSLEIMENNLQKVKDQLLEERPMVAVLRERYSCISDECEKLKLVNEKIACDAQIEKGNLEALMLEHTTWSLQQKDLTSQIMTSTNEVLSLDGDLIKLSVAIRNIESDERVVCEKISSSSEVITNLLSKKHALKNDYITKSKLSATAIDTATDSITDAERRLSETRSERDLLELKIEELDTNINQLNNRLRLETMRLNDELRFVKKANDEHQLILDCEIKKIKSHITSSESLAI